MLVVANAFITRSGMLTDRKNLVEQETQSAMGVVSYYQKEAAAGHVSADDAKRLAIATLRNMRYGDGNSGYFGIYESNAVALLMPPRPEMEGKSQAVDGRAIRRAARRRDEDASIAAPAQSARASRPGTNGPAAATAPLKRPAAAAKPVASAPARNATNAATATVAPKAAAAKPVATASNDTPDWETF
ncbi:MAG: cache domain-containing protein [Paraburkholderia sp.]|nr:cache domain-containing protein [Paraburkholderia sp.]